MPEAAAEVRADGASAPCPRVSEGDLPSADSNRGWSRSVSLLWHLATAGQLPGRAAVGLAVVGLAAVNGAAPAQALSSEGLAPPCIISQSPWLLPSYLSNSIPSPFIWQRNHGSVGRKRCNV